MAKLSNSTKTKKSKEPTPEEDVVDAGEEDEEEYEVDEIKDDRKNRQTGRAEYFVSWVGYGPADDLWISEENMTGCEEKLKAYWDNKPRTSNQPGKVASRKKEKAKINGSDVAPKKRGRPSKVQDEEEEEENFSKKKKKKPMDPEDGEEWSEEQLAAALPAIADRTFKANHIAYKHSKSWEKKVESIDTIVQRPPQYPGEGHLVGVNWHSGFYSWVPTYIVNEKCPQKMLEFYQRNLTFKSQEDIPENAEDVQQRGIDMVEETINEVET